MAPLGAGALVVSLMVLSPAQRLHPGGHEQQPGLVRRELDERAGAIAGCDGLQSYAQERGDANIARAEGVRIGDLPEAVREAVARR